MANLQEYQKLKNSVEARQREYDRAQGSFDALEKRICAEFSVSGIDEAKKLLGELQAKEAAAQEAFDDALTAFKKKYPDCA